MITNIKVNNFKSLNFEDALPLNSLNLFCGSNSSGKSSLIQIILMLSQTLGSRFSKKTVALNGHLVRLGGFEDIKSKHLDGDNVSISFNLEISNLLSSKIKSADIRFDFGVDYPEIDNSQPGEQLNPELQYLEVKLYHDCETGKELTSNISIRKKIKKSNESVFGEGDFIVENISGDCFDELLSSYPECNLLGCSVSDLLPDEFTLSYDNSSWLAEVSVDKLTSHGRRSQKYLGQRTWGVNKAMPNELLDYLCKLMDRDVNKRYQVFIRKIKSLNIDFFNDPHSEDLIHKSAIEVFKNINSEEVSSSDLKMFFPSFENITFDKWDEFCTKISRKKKLALFSFITNVRFELISLLKKSLGKDKKLTNVRFDVLKSVSDSLYISLCSGVKYLGPLRNEPMSVYPVTNYSDKNDIGVKGENSAAVFHINKKNIISYPSTKYIDIGSFFDKEDSEFGLATIRWLIYLGVLESIETTDRGKFGYELKVRVNDSDDFQDLTHVGVGVSQVLPIVMLCLLSNHNDILIFEQPELHLHPKIQARLTDFFIAMSLNNRQVFIETHSEYMINRLRYRIASSSDESIKSKVNIRFVNKVSGTSEFNSVDISNFGSITNWPLDFFDQTQNEVERILIAASKKKKELRLRRTT